MSNLFDEDDEFVEEDEAILETHTDLSCDARRRLENLLEEKRLRDELDDYLDY